MRFWPAFILALSACNPDEKPAPLPIPACDAGGRLCPDPIQISELMADNEGTWVDEAGQTDDWIELTNTGDEDVWLIGYSLGAVEPTWTLMASDIWLGPGEVVLLWADDDVTQGSRHLPFKLSSGGEMVQLWAPDGRLVDRVTYPGLGLDTSYARLDDGTRVVCRFPSPTRPNGSDCAPPPPAELPEDVTFAPYDWPEPWPQTPGPLAIDEVALRPAGFVEIHNRSTAAIDLSGWTLAVAPQPPGDPWPNAAAGTPLALPASIAAGAHLTISVDASATAALEADPDFEGVVTLFRPDGSVQDRFDFMAWPNGAALARFGGRIVYCSVYTPGAANLDCQPLASRPLFDRVRHFHTPGDFAALARGGTALGIESVKFIVDMDAGDVVHFLSSTWDLHYTWIRERIEHLAHLDRCDPAQSSAFFQGWAQFSQEQYFTVEGRRYLLGTLEHYLGPNLHTVEYTTGDRITASWMARAFFAVAARLPEPTAWWLRPQGQQQIDTLRHIEGSAPIIGPSAPFQGITVQLMNEGVAYGVLSFVPGADLDSAALGPQTILLTDEVPNDVPLVGGVITESFQTPLAHVSVLSRNRGTPDLAVRDARHDPRIAPWLDQLVRLEVTTTGFSLVAADSAEAEAFWASRNERPPLSADLDTTARGPTTLAGRGLEDLPAFGAKAAQLAELGRVSSRHSLCLGPLPLPASPFAIPVVHFIEHAQASGATVLLARQEADPTFRTDPRVRAAALAEVQSAILAHPVEPGLLADLTAHIASTFGTTRMRFRSSSNAEDLPGFSGAGLYISLSGAIDDPERPIDDALRSVWASLYYLRAYDERRFFNIVESSVAMGVLVHPVAQNERLNGVGITRNILDPIRGDVYYLNLQVGEASVVKPAPGVTTTQLLYRWGRTPRFVYQAYSSLPGAAVLTVDAELDQAACVLRAIHDHFEPLLNPDGTNPWFAMDVEFKRLSDGTFQVKQTRPYSFGAADVPSDCREF